MTDTEGGTARYSVPQAARYLGISERAIRKRIATGTLRAERDGRQWAVLLPAVPGAVPSGPAGGTEPEPIELSPTDAGAAQLAILRDTLLAPLIAQNERQQATITDQATTIGALQQRIRELEGTQQPAATPRPPQRWAFWRRRP